MKKFLITSSEVLPFSDIKKGMGFATKTLNTAVCFQRTSDLAELAKAYLSSNITLQNTNGTGFKSSLFRKFLEMYNFDLLNDAIINEYNHKREINVKDLAAKVQANLPENFSFGIVVPEPKELCELLQSIVLSQPLPVELQVAIRAERSRQMSEYGALIAFYFRSAGSKGEDDNIEQMITDNVVNATRRLMIADPTISKVQTSKMGAGQHESYMEIDFRSVVANSSTEESCILAYHHVLASTYSFQATSDYTGMRDKDGTWFHSGIDMDVIMMPITHSHLGGSGLGFSDVIDGITEITFGEKVRGHELVGGTQDFPVTNTRMLPNGEILVNTISGYLSPEISGVLKAIAVSTAYIEQLEAPETEAVQVLGKPTKMCVDSEWAFGPLYEGSEQFVLSMVQYRTFIPAQQARSADHQIVYELIEEHYKVLQDKPVVVGTSVGEMCAVGPVIHIHSKTELMDPKNVRGKILIVDQAYTELLGTIKLGAIAWIVKPKALKAHATLNGDGEICQLQGVDAEKLSVLKNGEVVTVLFNELFIGDLSNCFKKETIDLSKILTTDLIKLGLVEGNVSASRRRKLFPYLRLGVLHDNDLFRYEAAGWGASVPGLFNWVFYSSIDETSKEGREAKEYIRLAMLTYDTTDPVEAYIQRMAGVMFPLCAFSEYFDKSCHIRMYGARLDEDHAYVTYNFPHEPNPIIGFNGAAMYGTDWGRIAATISLKTLKELEKYGCYSSSIFIPNIISTVEVIPYVEEAIELGLDVASRGVKLMIENSVSMAGYFIDKPYMEKEKGLIEFKKLAPSLNEYREQLANRGYDIGFSMSYGFNDFTNSWKGRDGRHCDLPGCTLSDIYTYYNVSDFTKKAVENGYIVNSCGMPEEGVMLAMLQNGAKGIGVPGGLKAVKAAELLYSFALQIKAKK